MTPQSFSTSSSSIILFLFIFSSLSCISHAHYSATLSSETQTLPSSLDFLKNLNGTHKGQIAKGVSELRNYLTNLGYIAQNDTPTQIDLFDDTLETALQKYQEFYSLNITGVLDQQTMESLSRPRCGVPDIRSDGNGSISASLYTFLATKWPPGKRQLTFSYPKNIRGDAKTPVQRALTRWMNVSPFRFTYTDEFGTAEVKISFERRDHGDGAPFDGPGGILAHAFSPTGGQLHFDADESWKTDESQGEYDLQSVALHELGHILGLAHSQDPKASMYAYFQPGEVRDLNNDDIQGIRALYPN